MIKYVFLLLIANTAIAVPLPVKADKKINLNWNNFHTTEKVYKSFSREEKRLWNIGHIILDFEELKLNRSKKGDGICYQETHYLKGINESTPLFCAKAFIKHRLIPDDRYIRNIFKNITVKQEAGLIANLYRRDKSNFKKGDGLYDILTKIYKKNYFTSFSKEDKIKIMRQWYFVVPRHIKEAQFLRLTRTPNCTKDCYGGWINRADEEMKQFFNISQKEIDELKNILIE